MTFIHPLLLSGLLLVGVPVLIHLIMQQKPKRLPFPAFRFLLQRHRTNQRTLRLRHLLLLAMRILAIAAICLALARPKLFSEGAFNLSEDRSIAAALLFDTSLSMEYTVAGRTRLEDAKRRALELLDELPPGSRVAVFDSAESGGEWLASVALARERITALKLRPGNAPLTRQLDQVYRLFDKLDQEKGDGEEALPKLLYIFSDRTQSCWDAEVAKNLKQPTGVQTAFVDVGIENPADLAIVNLELPREIDREQTRQVFGTRDTLTLRATVRASGNDCDTFFTAHLDDKKQNPIPVVLKAGQTKTLPVVFDDLRDLRQGPHHVRVDLANNDALPFNNSRFATFEIRDNRQVLVLADNPEETLSLQNALKSGGVFHADVKTSANAADFVPNELLKNYRALCLMSVARPSASLWSKLQDYVAQGGGLAIFPGENLIGADYNQPTAQAVVPAEFGQTVTVTEDKPVSAWHEPQYQRALLAPFRIWSQSDDSDFLKGDRVPLAYRYWLVKPQTKALVLLRHGESSPALIEHQLGKGRVLLFTTAFDDHKPLWNNFRGWWFYLALVNETFAYLAGDAEAANFNYVAGQPIIVTLPAAPRLPLYTLSGPGLVGAETQVSRSEQTDTVRLPQAATPGNFTLYDKDAAPVAGFSINAAPEESQLSRAPVEQIEAVLGEGAVLPVGHDTPLGKALAGRWRQPLELFPWLMILLLLALTIENFLSNRFYKRSQGDIAVSNVPTPAAVTSEKETAVV